jgi:hypothetical protein
MKTCSLGTPAFLIPFATDFSVPYLSCYELDAAIKGPEPTLWQYQYVCTHVVVLIMSVKKQEVGGRQYLHTLRLLEHLGPAYS